MNSIVELASNFIGKVKYVFGANNITGGEGDCSSFTQYVYNQHGVNIGRDTQSQWTSDLGTKVSKDDLKVGDLVFFKNTYQSNHTDGVSHVGIYSGGGEFIHLNSKGVTKDSLNSDYWTSHYLGAKTFNTSTEDTFTNTPVNNVTKVGFWGDVKDFFKDQAEFILTFILLAVVTVTGVIALINSIKQA